MSVYEADRAADRHYRAAGLHEVDGMGDVDEIGGGSRGSWRA